MKQEFVQNVADFVLHTGEIGCVLETKEVPELLFEQKPEAVLALYLYAARAGATIDMSTFQAAQTHVFGISQLPPAQVFAYVNEILRTSRPDALAPLVGVGALARFGLPAPRGCLSALILAEESPCARWAALLDLCGAQYGTVARILPLHRLMAITPVELLAEGVRRHRLARVCMLLTDLILRQPHMNAYTVLLQTALALQQTIHP